MATGADRGRDSGEGLPGADNDIDAYSQVLMKMNVRTTGKPLSILLRAV